ncbi:MAG: hypothetical protein E7481_05530 [Ruminococcaceae bacterium]|nr:hypothetical protein [Oscillospiraceae bacterium]
MAKDKEQKYIKPGEPLKQSTVIVFSVAGGLFAILLYAGLTVDGAWPMILIGAAFFLFGILVTLPNILGFIRGKRREHLIKTGKLVEPPKKTFNPHSRFDD